MRPVIIPMAGYFVGLLAFCCFCDYEHAFAFSISSSIVLPRPEGTRRLSPTRKDATISLVGAHDDALSSNSFAPLFQIPKKRTVKKALQPLIPRTGSFQQSHLCIPCQLRKWSRMTSRISRLIRRTIAVMALLLAVFFTVLPPAIAAGSSGRMGGSFGSSRGKSGGGHGVTTKVYSSSPGRTSRPSYYSSPSFSRGSGRTYRVLPIPYRYHHRPRFAPATRGDLTTTIAKPDGTTTIVRRETRHSEQPQSSISDAILVTGAASCVAYGIAKHYREIKDGGPDTPLGPGVSVLSLTACLNVPDRKDPNSILYRLSRLAQSSDTSSRNGLKSLLADTALELARQEKAVVSVESHYCHMKTPIQAERQYNQFSTQQRSKFDKESLSNYGGKRINTGSEKTLSSAMTPSATVALVNIHLAIEGNTLQSFDNIKSRKQLTAALVQISSDVQVDDCLLAAEVIWSPEDPTEQVTMEDVYSDFPTLYTLMD